MNEREELEALRRLAELEAKAAGNSFGDSLSQANQAQSRQMMTHPVVQTKPKDLYAKQAGEQSFLQNILAGAGGALYGLGTGLTMSPNEVKDWKASMSGLGTTVGGTLGQIAGYSAPAALAAPFAGASVPVAAGVGALEGALMPAESLGERGFNTLASGGGAMVGQAGGNKLAQMANARAAAKKADIATKQAQNVVRDATLAMGKGDGFVVPPSYAGTGVFPRFMEGISGKYKTNQLAGIKNQKVINSLIREDVGLPGNQAATLDDLAKLRAQHGQVWENLRSYDAPSVDELFPLPATSPSTVSTTAKSTSKAIDYNKDSIDDAVRKFGGINIKDGGGELRWLRESDLGKGNPRLGAFATKNGKSLDDMADLLYQHGYIDERDINLMLEKLEQAAGGNKIYSMNMDDAALANLSGYADDFNLPEAEKIIKGNGTINADDVYKSDLNAIKSKYGGAGKSFPGLARNEVGDMIDALDIDRFNIGDSLDAVSRLRESADRAYRSGDAGLGKASREASKAIENMIERHLESVGAPKWLLDDLRNARVNIAKLRTAERSLNPATGDFDANVFGSLYKKGKPLTGGMEKVGRFNAAFHDVTQVPKSGDANPITAFDWLTGSGIGGAAMMLNPSGWALAAAPAAARIASRYSLLSAPVQKALVNPKYSIGTLNKILPGLLSNPVSSALYPGAGIYGYGLYPNLE